MLIAITALSVVVAASMTIVAWRLSREERRRSGARVAALAAEVRLDGLPDLPLQHVTGPELLAPAAHATGHSRMAAVLAIGVFIVGSAAALAVVLSGSGAASRVSAPRAEARASSPLELVALSHARDGDALTVQGIVRNPAAGNEVDRLSAVVFLFGGDGAFRTSMRVAVDRATLPAGAESAFRVVVPNAADVSRYRVSFRTDSAVVPHVDRRGPSDQSQR